MTTKRINFPVCNLERWLRRYMLQYISTYGNTDDWRDYGNIDIIYEIFGLTLSVVNDKSND